jgi:hypothetical protein
MDEIQSSSNRRGFLKKLGTALTRTVLARKRPYIPVVFEAGAKDSFEATFVNEVTGRNDFLRRAKIPMYELGEVPPGILRVYTGSPKTLLVPSRSRQFVMRTSGSLRWNHSRVVDAHDQLSRRSV